MRRLVLAAFALTLLTACQPATTDLTEEQNSEITAEITAVLDTFWDAWAQVDYDRGFAYWEDSPELLFAGSEGDILRGFATMDRLYRPFFATLRSQEFDLNETHIKVITRDAAYAMQRGTYAQTDTSGVTGPTRPLAYTYLWIRTADGWKITSAHMSQGDPVTQ
jgi:hypothetical protein